MHDEDYGCAGCTRKRDIPSGKPWHMYLAQSLFVDSTRPLRLILAVVNILFVSYMLAQQDLDPNFSYLWASLSHDNGPMIWASLFGIHAFYLLKGLDGEYNWRTLLFEGLLGWFIWVWTAMTSWAAQGVPGPTLACALMATLILVRYPTHWTQWGDRDGA